MQKALNRGEAYHRFRRAVAYLNGGAFGVKTEAEHQYGTSARGLSPVAWQHVNLFGNFEFSDAQTKVDLDALAALFAEAAYWSRVFSGGRLI